MTFEDALRAHGLLPKKAIVPDGRWYRCSTSDHPKSDNGAYKLALDGRIGWYQNHAVESAPSSWRIDQKAHVDALPPPIDWAALRRQREIDRAALRTATAAAREFYTRCEPLRGGHPYLGAHGLDMAGCEGLKVDSNGWLVVPAYRGRDLTSLQRIAPDGSKRFWPGASMRGVSYTVNRRDAKYTVLCEGLATGLAIYACSELVRVVVAFTASNLVKVAETLDCRGFVTVAADNDWKTAAKLGKNPGITAANDAAQVLGCGVMVPEGIEGTDWCDWRQERLGLGLEAKSEHTTPGTVRRAVDAGIFREVQRHSMFRIGAKTA